MHRVRLLAAAAFVSIGGVAHAATCDVNPQGANFGAYDALSAVPLDTVGNIGIACDAVVPVTISLGPGAGTYQERRMQGGAAELTYNLYTDPARTIVWGDGSGDTSSVSVNAQTAAIPIYGRVPARQPIPPAAYADTIVVTISY